MSERLPPSDATHDEPIDADPLPSPGDVVRIRATVHETEPAEPGAAPRGLAIFVDADGEEVAVDDKLPVFGPDERGRIGVRARVLGVAAGGEGLRVRVSLAEPDGLALEDGRAEVEVPLDLLTDR